MAPCTMRGRTTSWRYCVCPVTFSAPSRFGVSLPMTLKLTAVRLAWSRRRALPAHPRHLGLAPLRAGREAGAIATESFRLLEDGLHGLLDVEQLGHGLRGVPRGVDEELEPVALGIGEVDRPGVAVGDDPELLDALVARPRMHDLEILEGGQLERHLIDHVELEAGRPASSSTWSIRCRSSWPPSRISRSCMRGRATRASSSSGSSPTATPGRSTSPIPRATGSSSSSTPRGTPRSPWPSCSTSRSPWRPSSRRRKLSVAIAPASRPARSGARPRWRGWAGSARLLDQARRTAVSFSVIGKGTPKRDGAEKVTGHTQFLHDVVLPRMVHGAILRTQYPHARILRIDTSAAEALPGVLAVITADRVEQHPVGFAKDHLALKGGTADGGKVRCIRDEIAAVAALTEEIAQEAKGLIRGDYEELPAVFDPDSALRPGAPLIHDELGTNLVNLKYQFSHGDVESAFAKAHVVVEGSYRLNYVTTACLGTMVAIAAWSPPGRPDASLTMWSTTQVPFLYQRDLAEALGITGDRVRVIQPPVGGNFGRGLDLYPIDIIAALLARRAGRPVKIAFERIEEFIARPTREPGVSHLRTAADRDGRLLARDARVMIDNGAYVSWGSTTPYVMLATTAGLYRVPSVRFETTIVYTNNPYSGSMRGYGNLESTFAIEAQMDDLAERLSLDKMEIRRRNATRSGEVNPQGSVITSCGMTECLDTVEREMRKPVARPPRTGWKRGVGFAAMFHVAGGARVYRPDGCGAIRKPDDFGKASLITGASEIGQGSETVLAMIVAEELGVPLGRVEVINSDTAVKPWDVGVHASRTTFIAGNAALIAARELKEKLLGLAASVMDER